MMVDRAILFIDGNNWYHSLRELGATDLINLNYGKISEKLVKPRDWIGTRYYIGRMNQAVSADLYAKQRRFISRLTSKDVRVTAHFGRIEPQRADNPLAREVRRYLSRMPTRIDRSVYADLVKLTKDHEKVGTLKEKAVDVMLAVDMVTMAAGDHYDAAYILSADGDFTPAANFVRSLGKKVYAASPHQGAQLGAVVDAYIRIDKQWLDDCYD